MGPRFHVIDPAWKAYEELHPISVPDALDAPHDMTIAAAAALNVGLTSSGDGPGAPRTPNPCRLPIRVHPSSIDRALRISDVLVKACEARGFGFRLDRHSPEAGAAVVVDGEAIPLMIYERMARRPYKPTRKELARKERGDLVHVPIYEYQPSGELSLRTDRSTTWKDHPGRKLEAQLNDVMLGLRAMAVKRRDERRQRQEFEERVEAFHARRDDLRQRVEDEQEAVDRLEREADAWRRAATIRAYVAAVEAQPAAPRRHASGEAWAPWARAQADRLDPLTHSPSSILDTAEEDYREYSPFDELPDHLFEHENEA